MPYRFDPELASLVEITPHVTVDDITATRARAAELMLAATREIDLTGVNITDTCVPGPPDAPDVAVRIYTPVGVARPTPAVLHLPGGGFVAGGLGTEHRANIGLSRAVGAVVVAVDYRLAPEHPYPSALEDCYAALCWMAARADRLGVDPNRIAVHGAHAGGGLAAALALLTRDRGGPALCFQCLDFPELDDRRAVPSLAAAPVGLGDALGGGREHRPGTTGARTDSAGADGGSVGAARRADTAVHWDAYLGEGRAGTDGVPLYAAPARAEDLRGLPPAYVCVQERDRLREQGVAYADALRSAGVPARLQVVAGSAPEPAPRRRAASPETVAALRAALHGRD
ncbi:alpha/beta hydrolase fold domain-containing protein [Parafrankia sp. BMG5.11]|uniref:alpha/beta hydrolase fold domain-containing protein n=1 Tax=Parafrankia sp. BMG5.11 TaxID=222540 RepID=UPI00103E4C96|nr:alpha/beta hydrolase fold domain-containing protein [Parafrankia sp. BMG5.11]TCJ32840.1 alpha/beta hydrolase [Parafrankia sp. BMG5.11]